MSETEVVKLGSRQLANRVQWVRDLLSDQFKQGKGVLKRGEDGQYYYCCLGVACERAMPRSPALKIIYGLDESVGIMIPAKAKEKFGLDEDDQDAAAEWNDTLNLSFSRIADVIAYATEHELRFYSDAISPGRVPYDYALQWLAQFDK